MTKTALITPGSFSKLLVGIILTLLIANTLSIFLRTVYGYDFQFIHTFDFNREYNIPSLYSSLTLLISAGLMHMIGKLESEQGKKWSWRLLALMFVFLSADELVGIHENSSNETESLLGNFNADGYFHFVWVVPYLVLVLATGMVMLRFFFKLPHTTRIRFGISAILFVGGALGMEMVSGRMVYLYGDIFRHSALYGVLYTLEELLEMAGIVLLIHTLIQYYVLHAQGQHVQFHVLLRDGKDPVTKPVPAKRKNEPTITL